MIMKERKRPLQLIQLEVLLRRIPKSHPKRPFMEEEFAKRITGFRGEESLDYHLGFLSNEKYAIFHDLRLSNQNRFFQIDTLIVSTNFILIIEVKNIIGTLYFDEQFQQLIRTFDGKEEGLPDPLMQVRRQQFQLYQWLERHHFPKLPIETLVVISNPTTIIKSSHPTLAQVIHAAKLPIIIKQLEHQYNVPKLQINEIKRLTTWLKEKHVPPQIDIFRHFNIQQHEIMKGVHCPSCDFLPIVKTRGAWTCPKCKQTSEEAFVLSLKDYQILYGNIISNKQFRLFLQVPSRTTARNLLKTMNLKHIGKKKGYVYILPDG
ncbi:hypothetical protein J2S13_001361 [Oikeobacillus pervagus]|uniref:NERD domain-containing protein n=1 Tax=Oikeobacillus pervagus TaxID=1325931 RepID=A0AAJ1T094_9BACI|nr:nuclease-related domain-containing protein [Oikeobacillus pervagus]MDQ0214962.1 hypothetical protein [Oikeobacillus pervagus]